MPTMSRHIGSCLLFTETSMPCCSKPITFKQWHKHACKAPILVSYSNDILRVFSMVGIPINGTLLPALPGFQLSTGVDLDYDENVDFYCTGSSTSKPVCQLYGNAKVQTYLQIGNRHVTTWAVQSLAAMHFEMQKKFICPRRNFDPLNINGHSSFLKTL